MEILGAQQGVRRATDRVLLTFSNSNALLQSGLLLELETLSAVNWVLT